MKQFKNHSVKKERIDYNGNKINDVKLNEYCKISSDYNIIVSSNHDDYLCKSLNQQSILMPDHRFHSELPITTKDMRFKINKWNNQSSKSKQEYINEDQDEAKETMLIPDNKWLMIKERIEKIDNILRDRKIINDKKVKWRN